MFFNITLIRCKTKIGYRQNNPIYLKYRSVHDISMFCMEIFYL
jgi:hypothetical protein